MHPLFSHLLLKLLDAWSWYYSNRLWLVLSFDYSCCWENHHFPYYLTDVLFVLVHVILLSCHHYAILLWYQLCFHYIQFMHLSTLTHTFWLAQDKRNIFTEDYIRTCSITFLLEQSSGSHTENKIFASNCCTFYEALSKPAGTQLWRMVCRKRPLCLPWSTFGF